MNVKNIITAFLAFTHIATSSPAVFAEELMSTEVAALSPLVTRAEFVEWVVRDVYSDDVLAGDCFFKIAPDPRRGVTYTHLFSDVLTESTYALPLCVGMLTGVVSGTPDGMFRPREPISYVEAAKIITKAYGIAPMPPLVPDKRVPWYEPFRYALARRDAVPPNVKKMDQSLTQDDVRHLVRTLANEKPLVGFRYPNDGARPFTQWTLESVSSRLVAFASDANQNLSNIAPVTVATDAPLAAPEDAPVLTSAIAPAPMSTAQEEATNVSEDVSPEEIESTPNNGSFGMRLLDADARNYRPPSRR